MTQSGTDPRKDAAMRTNPEFWYIDREVFIVKINTNNHEYRVVTIIYCDGKPPRTLCYDLTVKAQKEKFDRAYEKARSEFLSMWM